MTGRIPVASQPPPASTPLTTCLNPTPARPRALDTPLARHFAYDRVQSSWSLDGGDLAVDPPPSTATPLIGPEQALCNLLAARISFGPDVLTATVEHGMSFGLAVVTISDSILSTTTPVQHDAGGFTGTAPPALPETTASSTLQPYHHRLAWIAVVTHDAEAACPANIGPVRTSPPPSGTRLAPTNYDVFAIDAATGAAGVDYAARTSGLCGYGYEGPSVTAAVVFVSVPWTFVRRTVNPAAAAITYAPRSCDDRIVPLDERSAIASVFAGDNPARVEIVVTRVLTDCGPPVTVSIILHSSIGSRTLPALLVHAPLGAVDVHQSGQ